MASSKNKKRIFNPLSNDTNNSSTMINMITNTDNKSQESTNETSLPAILANLTTGMDVFPIDRSKLVAAPKEWNFYSPLAENKMTELIQSIEERGLLHPIVVWQQSEDAYMILSGHNRNSAYEYLYNYYKDTEPEKSNIYKTIHAHIFKKEDLEEEDAKQIIIDTNWVTRELSPLEKQKSIFNKYISLGRKSKVKNGEGSGDRLRDSIGEAYSLSGRQVSRYIKLNYLIPEFLDMIDGKILTINSGVKLADFSVEIQQWILDNFKEKIDNAIISKLKKSMGKEEIELIFNPKKEIINANEYFETQNLSIPLQLKDKYVKIMFKFYKDNNLINDNTTATEFLNTIIKHKVEQ